MQPETTNQKRNKTHWKRKPKKPSKPDVKVCNWSPKQRRWGDYDSSPRQTKANKLLRKPIKSVNEIKSPLSGQVGVRAGGIYVHGGAHTPGPHTTSHTLRLLCTKSPDLKWWSEARRGEASVGVVAVFLRKNAIYKCEGGFKRTGKNISKRHIATGTRGGRKWKAQTNWKQIKPKANRIERNSNRSRREIVKRMD